MFSRECLIYIYTEKLVNDSTNEKIFDLSHVAVAVEGLEDTPRKEKEVDIVLMLMMVLLAMSLVSVQQRYFCVALSNCFTTGT